MPVAWRWPFSNGQIHTSCHAGGIASERMRATTAASVMARPSASKKLKFRFPLRRRLKPATLPLTYRSPAARADSTTSGAGGTTVSRRGSRNSARRALRDMLATSARTARA
jgi:hypothetical protein